MMIKVKVVYANVKIKNKLTTVERITYADILKYNYNNPTLDMIKKSHLSIFYVESSHSQV